MRKLFFLLGLFISGVLFAFTGYVANEASNNVSVIDTSTNAVIGTIPVGTGPFWVVIAPSGNFVYVTNNSSDNVSVISTATDTVVQTIPLSSPPNGAAITPDGAFLYVANGLNVSIINTSTNTITATVPISAPAVGIVITPGGAFAYLTTAGESSVIAINTSTHTVVATIIVSSFNPRFPAATPNGSFVYVPVPSLSLGVPDIVNVIRTSNNTIAATIPVDPSTAAFPNDAAVSPNGAFAYIVNQGNGTLSIIATATNTITATVTITSTPNTSNTVTFSPDGAFAYVTSDNEGVQVLNTSTLTFVATIPVGTQPEGIAILSPAPPPPSVLPPTSITARQIKNRFLGEYEYVNQINWGASPSSTITYRVFRNGVLIASLPQGTTCYKDHNQTKQPIPYTVVAVDANGNQSTAVSVTVP